MKHHKEVVACVMDAGTFIPLAQRLAKDFHRVYYYSPFESEYLDVRDCIIGDGVPRITRLDEPLDLRVFAEIDLFIFPDIGFAGLQRHLRADHKAVWGSARGTELELYRSYFLQVVKKAGLPVVGHKVLKGVTALSDYLKETKNKWVKIDRFRGNMETWHHIDYEHSLPTLRSLYVTFGGVAELITFVVVDSIDSDPDSPVMEIGYDGWNIDGNSPSSSFQGYEKKNELYLGSMKRYRELPEEVRHVNEAMAPFLAQMTYRNFWATELRVKDGVPWFIDPTARMPGQTGEQLLESCANLGEVIWHGANGELVEPEWNFTVAAEATLHYKSECEDAWKVLTVPEECERWVKLYQFCMVDGKYHFPPGKNDEVGVVVGGADSVEDAIDNLKENFEPLKDEPVSIDTAGFAELIRQIEDAEAEGMPFAGELPKPEAVIEE